MEAFTTPFSFPLTLKSDFESITVSGNVHFPHYGVAGRIVASFSISFLKKYFVLSRNLF